MTKILSFDPGGITGWAYVDTQRDTVFGGGQISGDGIEEYHFKLYQFIRQIKPDVIVYERFEYRANVEETYDEDTGQSMSSKGINLISRDYIGVIKLYTQVYKCQLVGQMPAQAVGKDNKIFFNMRKLKHMGLYVKGMPHQIDATRHLLFYLMFTLNQKFYYHYIKPSTEQLTLADYSTAIGE